MLSHRVMLDIPVELAFFVAKLLAAYFRQNSPAPCNGRGNAMRGFPLRLDVAAAAFVASGVDVPVREIRPGMDAYELLRGVGNLCIGAGSNPRYDARRMVELVIAGLRLH